MQYIFGFMECEYGVTEKMLVGRSRKNEIKLIRHIFIKSLYDTDLVGSENLGKIMGNRDHSTILNSLQKASNLIDTEKEYRSAYEKINSKISQLLFSN